MRKTRPDRGPRSRDLPVEARPRWFYWVAGVLLLAGLGGRLWLTALAPRWGFWADHFDNIGMGLTAEQHGLLNVYSVPVQDNPTVSGYVWTPLAGRTWLDRKPPRVTNYPPLGVALFWMQSSLLDAVQSSLEANTFTSRLVMSLSSVAAELLLALLVFRLGTLLGGPKAGLLAAGVCWLFPPLAMDSSLWGQADAWIAAAATGTVLAMLRRRWFVAGLCTGLAVLLKTHGILLGPVLLFGAATVAEAEGRLTLKAFLGRVGSVAVATVGTVLLLSAPWIAADGLSWVQQAYLGNIKMYPLTTLKAFNVWYLDALLLDAKLVGGALDSTATLAGIRKDLLGRTLVLAAMVGLAAACWRVCRRRPTGLVLFAGLWLWSTFIWPTRVHERYILYCMPLVIVAACSLRRLWPAVVVLALVGAAELSWNIWLKMPPAGQYDENQGLVEHSAKQPAVAGKSDVESKSRYRRWYRASRQKWQWQEYTLTIASLAGYGWAVLAPFLWVATAARTRFGAPRRSRAPPARRRHR